MVVGSNAPEGTRSIAAVVSAIAERFPIERQLSTGKQNTWPAAIRDDCQARTLWTRLLRQRLRHMKDFGDAVHRSYLHAPERRFEQFIHCP